MCRNPSLLNSSNDISELVTFETPTLSAYKRNRFQGRADMGREATLVIWPDSRILLLPISGESRSVRSIWRKAKMNSGLEVGFSSFDGSAGRVNGKAIEWEIDR